MTSPHSPPRARARKPWRRPFGPPKRSISVRIDERIMEEFDRLFKPTGSERRMYGSFSPLIEFLLAEYLTDNLKDCTIPRYMLTDPVADLLRPEEVDPATQPEDIRHDDSLPLSLTGTTSDREHDS